MAFYAHVLAAIRASKKIQKYIKTGLMQFRVNTNEKSLHCHETDY